MGGVGLLDGPGEQVLVAHAPDVREGDFVGGHDGTVHHREAVPRKVGVHVVEIAVSAVNPLGVVSAGAEHVPDAVQVVVPFKAHDGHARQRRTGQRERLDAPDRTRARGIDVTEIERPGGEGFEVRRQHLAVAAEFAEELGAHAFHEHDDHVRPKFRSLGRGLIDQRSGIAHAACVRGQLGSQRRHHIGVGPRQIEVVVGQLVGEKGMKQAVQAVLGKLGQIAVPGVFGDIHKVHHIE